MIDSLITGLSKELELSAEEIADTIWLALQIQESQSESTATQNLKDDLALTPLKQSEPTISQDLPQKTSESEKIASKQPPDEQKAGIYPRNQHETLFNSGLSFKVPDAPSLREPLTLARALKPLMRRIPSGTTLVLDEAATTQRIADEGLWLPVLRPTLEPWLDLELVVDEGISMQIWRHTIRELERLLKNYGIFRDVRVWGLIVDNLEQVQIRRGIGATAKNQPPRSPAELIDPSGRRLVLLVSDCVSSFWRNGGITPVLELWAKQGSIAIVQMLPKWLWKRTALGRASEVRLQGLNPGEFNQKLIAKEVSLWDELEETRGVKVPVFTLEPDKVTTWAQMLSGKGSIWTLGYVFKLDLIPVRKGRELLNLDYGQLSAEQRVQAFRVTASPMARKLAGLLAAAPAISLPIVRLIQETLLKESQQVHVAEVFLGGLLRPLSEINAETNPNYVQYEFMDGVRNLLVDSVPSGYVLNVVDEVSKYVAKKVGLSLEDFVAVLRNPQQVRVSKIVGDIGYFATVTAQILRSLGGDYASFAEELKSYNKPHSQENAQPDLDYLSDIEYTIGGTLHQDSLSYIKRKADDALYNAVKRGRFCIVSAPRQMGKSSLIVRVRKRLEQEGFACASIDLSAIGVHNITPKQWYTSLVSRVARAFKLRQNSELKSWFKEREQLSPVHFFEDFIEEVLLKEISESIVIFIDEIDAILSLDFREDFFFLLRSLYGRRAEKDYYNRLNFILSGVFLDSDLTQNIIISPLTNIAFKVNLEGFSYEEALPLAGGLAEKTDNPQALLREILEWTGGQPFLTQKLCLLVKKSENNVPEGSEKAWLQNLVITKIIERWEEQDNPSHLQTIQDRILWNANKASELLNLYKSTLQREEYFERGSKVIRELMLTGLVVRRDGKLEVANKIYAEVFNQEWIEQNLAKLINITSNSNLEIDYTQLRNLLEAKKWREADQETARLMLKITNREGDGWLRVEDIDNFSCTDLQTIDQFWVNASNGHFGFSVQKKIWQELGEQVNIETERKLGKRLGWFNLDEWWLDYWDLTFSLDAPEGHLPANWDCEGIDGQEAASTCLLMSRLVGCAENQQIDYTHLRNFLAEGKWKEADRETARLIFKIANREKEGWLRVEDIEQFPISSLRTIDQLWVKYSNGQFGFSVQKRIYQSLGGTKEFNQEITEKFWKRVGLIVNNQPYWSQYDNLTFNLSAPIGHLPIRYDVETPSGVFGVIEGLLSRPDLEINYLLKVSAKSFLEDNLDEIKDLIIEEFKAQEYEFTLNKHPKDYEIENISHISLDEDEKIEIEIIKYQSEEIEKESAFFDLDCKIKFPVIVSYYDWDSYISQIHESDVPQKIQIYSNQIVQGKANILMGTADDIYEIEEITLKIDEPIIINDNYDNLKTIENEELEDEVDQDFVL